MYAIKIGLIHNRYFCDFKDPAMNKWLFTIWFVLTCMGQAVCQESEVTAKAVNEESIDRLVLQLGDADFQKREVAEKELIELAKADPDAVAGRLKSSLENVQALEVKHRLQRVIRSISSSVPIKKIEFSQARVNDKTWTLFNEPQKASYTFKAGVMEFDSLDRIKDAVMFVHRFDKGAQDRLVLDAEIKILKEKHNNAAGAGMHLNIEDGHHGYAMMITERGVFAYRNNRVHKMDTTDRWHHYRYVVEGPTQRFYIDDMDRPILELARRNGGGRNWASFGDGTSMAGAQAQIRNVTFSRFLKSR